MKIKTFKSDLGTLEVLFDDRIYFKRKDVVNCLGYVSHAGRTIECIKKEDCLQLKNVHGYPIFITANGVKTLLRHSKAPNKPAFEMWFEWILEELEKETVFVKVTVKESTPEGKAIHPLEHFCSNASPELKAAFFSAMEVMKDLNNKITLSKEIKELLEQISLIQHVSVNEICDTAIRQYIQNVYKVVA